MEVMWAIFQMNVRAIGVVFGLSCAMLHGVCSAQLMLHGMVVDSVTMEALPNVNIVIKTTGPGTVSDIRGSFALKAMPADTIVFSRVGYFTKVLPARSVNEVVIIFLKEERRMLDVVDISVKARPVWLPEIPPESPWKNPTSNTGNTGAGFQGVPTFGPGYVFKGVFSRLPKDEKERKKLAKTREENYRARNYISLVNDPEVKDRIKKEYGLTEAQYYKMLASFNEKNKDIIYRLEGYEVVSLLLRFFAEKNAEKK